MYERLVLDQQAYTAAPPPLTQFTLPIHQQAIYTNPHFYGQLSPTESLYSPILHIPSPPSTFVSSDVDESNIQDQDWSSIDTETTHHTPKLKVPNSKTREENEDDDDDQEDASSAAPSSSDKPPMKRRMAHNLVEKRYRNTINSEMERLRQMVPHVVTIDAQTPNGRSKASKATVLSSAVRYIQELEADRHRLAVENEDMRMAVGRYSNYRVG